MYINNDKNNDYLLDAMMQYQYCEAKRSLLVLIFEVYLKEIAKCNDEKKAELKAELQNRIESILCDVKVKKEQFKYVNYIKTQKNDIYKLIKGFPDVNDYLLDNHF